MSFHDCSSDQQINIKIFSNKKVIDLSVQIVIACHKFNDPPSSAASIMNTRATPNTTPSSGDTIAHVIHAANRHLKEV